MKRHSLHIQLAFLLAVLGGHSFLFAQTVHFFQDSENSSFYNSGLAFVTAPSTFIRTGVTNDKIPVSLDPAPREGLNSLQLQWQSNVGGNWNAFVIAPGFPFQNISSTDTLSFWCYTPEGISAAAMPAIAMEGAPGNTQSRTYALGTYSGDIPAHTWTQVKVPLQVFFSDPNQTGINFTQVKAIIFRQDAVDATPHTLYVDAVRTYRVNSAGGVPNIPQNLTATGYDSHVELSWQPGAGSAVEEYQLFRSTDGGQTYTLYRTFDNSVTYFQDFTRALGNNLQLGYRISAVGASGLASERSAPVLTQTREFSDEELLDMVQRYTFRYFWDFAHPVSGLARERNTAGETCTIGGSGFGIMAILVGIERGYITYQEGLDRILTTVIFLENADRFHGAFPHWINGSTGDVIPFSQQDNGGDLVETAFMIQGLLTAREYFSADDVLENILREKITGIWESVEWDWYRQNNQQVLYWHWSPQYNFNINFQLRGWNETMIVYLLAIASPTHGVPASLYHTGWASNGGIRNGFSYYGYHLPLGHLLGGPLFFTHYSFLGFDPRFLRDQYANYYEQNRNQTLINRAYCLSNPGQYEGYGANSWGLTASDNPFGYLAHEPSSTRDNGTIAPTAALSAMPYTFAESMVALKYFYRELGPRLWGPMGFYDAFNEERNWFASSYLAIDQGPIIGMIENHRSQLLWNNFMANPEMQTALDAIGFEPDSTITNTPGVLYSEDWAAVLSPNPVRGLAFLDVQMWNKQTLSLHLINAQGQVVKTIVEQRPIEQGQHRIAVDCSGVEPGVYILRVASGTTIKATKIIVL